MAKWKLPEGRKPITTMESANLVLRMHKKLEAGFSRGDRIAELEEMVEACKADAQEAEAYAAELEAKISKCVGALGDISNGEPEWPDDPQRELDWCRNRATTTLAELKGQDDE